MSNRLNAKFEKDPAKFMRNHPVDIYPFLGLSSKGGVNPLSAAMEDGGPPVAGVYDFDLWQDPNGLVRLTLFSDRTKAATDKSNKISAYWLPWDPRYKASVSFEDLDAAGVGYLFTSSLAGCRILITATKFYHISGQLNQQDRQAITDRATKGQRARAFSSTTGNAYGDGAFVVGYRSKHGNWRFIAQSSTRTPGTRQTITQVWSNNQLYEINATG